MARNEDIGAVAERLRSARKVLFITGAGVSAESGIPTFRGKEGWWRNYPPEELASPEGFARDPKMVWEWYNYRKQLIRDTSPNPAHIGIAEIERLLPNVLVATQNVDGLHHEAGSKNVIEIHGSIWKTRCTREDIEFEKNVIDTESKVPPVCPHCGSLVRPAVVWFGEMLPLEPLQMINNAIQEEPLVDVVFIVGTSAVFQYIIQWALIPQRFGAMLIEINPDSTPVTQYADFVFNEPAGETIPELVRELGKK
jgi:NAD-dependent deacetylase